MDKITALHGLSGTVDKVGIVSLELPAFVRTLADALTIRPSIAPSELDALNLRITGRKLAQSEDGSGFVVTFQIEGGNLAGPEGDFAKKDEPLSTFTIEGTMGEDPLKSHPNWEVIKNKYGFGTDRKREDEFPERIPNPKNGGNALSAKRTGTPETIYNPLFGVSAYLQVGVIVTITTALKALPNDLFEKIGLIFDLSTLVLPNNVRLPQVGRKRNWLKLAPQVRERGGILELVERYQLSGPNGWIPEIYDRDQLKS